MATLVSIADGNWTDASTWGLSDSTAVLDVETASGSSGTSYAISQSFTPGAITINKIGIKISGKSAGGTFTVGLRNVTGGIDVLSVVTNVSDLPTAGWFFVSFADTTLIAATAYAVQLKSSTGATVTMYRDGTTSNWSRQFVTTTTQAPVANDKIIVCGHHDGGTLTSRTVTMNNETTDSYGPTWSTDALTPGGIEVGYGGTLTWDTASGTDYYLKWKGRLNIWSGGIANVEIHSTSTAVLEMASAANVDSGLYVRIGGTLNVYGATARNRKVYLITDEAASATAIGVSDTTGWATGDVLVFASTTRTYTESEHKIISTVDSSTQVTLTAGLTNAHSGTSPTQGEVMNITSNIKFRGMSTSLQAYVRFDTTSVISIDNAEFYYLGSGTTGKRGIDIGTTTGSCSITNSSLHEFEAGSSGGFIMISASNANITLQDNVLYRIVLHINTQAITATSVIIDGCWCIYGLTAGAAMVVIGDNNITFTNMLIVSSSSTALQLGQSGGLGSASDITCHSNGGAGIQIANIINNTLTITNLTSWRNNNYGLHMSFTSGVIIDGLVCFGNTTRNIHMDTSELTLKNAILNGDTTFATTIGIGFGSSPPSILTVYNLDSGTVTGIKTAHTTGDIAFSSIVNCKAVLINCKLASTTEISTQSNIAQGAYISSQKHDQTTGLHKTFTGSGTITSETGTYKTASPSLKMEPLSTTLKMDTAAAILGRGMLYRVTSGATVTPTVWVRKNATYNGNAPRLIVRQNDAVGITTDTVLDTFTAAVDTWEQLTGTTITATDDGIMEFVVDCDGTAGAIFVDDWGPVAGNELKYWYNGLPSQDIFPAVTGDTLDVRMGFQS